MANIGFYKVLNALPVQIENDSFYLVSDSDRFDLYVTSNGVTPTAVRLANVKHLQEDTVPDPNDYYEGDEWLDVLTMTKYKLYYDGTKKIWVEIGNNPMMNPDLVYEAPIDGNQYARKDGGWEIVAIGDTSKWEDEGETLVRPKDGKKIDASHIEGLEQGGHIFEDSTDNTLPIRDVAKAGAGIEFEDDEVGEKTVVRVSKNLTDHIDETDEEKHTANQIYGGETDDNKIYYVDPTTKKLTPSNFTVDQIVQLSSIDVTDPTWMESESRLLEVEKTAEGASFKGATQLIDIFAPPAVDSLLLDQSGWNSNERKTITGENFRGELGRTGQVRLLDDGTICRCESSLAGDDGEGNGSANYSRNRAVDTLDPDSNIQDSNVCDLLDPTRTGGNTDDGWDVGTNIKVITSIPCRVGTWWKVAGGYSYFCYAVSGISYYWFRNGQPAGIYRYITVINYPVITSNLDSHDFEANGNYTDQSGDETTYQDQVYWNSITGNYFVKVTSSQWAKFYASSSSGLLTKRVTITNSQLKNLLATPITILPASGVDKINVIDNIKLIFKAGTEVLTEIDDNLSIRYVGGSNIVTVETTGLIDQPAEQLLYKQIQDLSLPISEASNVGIEIYNSGDAEIGGNASNDAELEVVVDYKIISI